MHTLPAYVRINGFMDVKYEEARASRRHVSGCTPCITGLAMLHAAQAAQSGSLWQGECGELPPPVFFGSCLVLLHVFSPSPRVALTLSGLKKDGCAGLALWLVGVVCVRVCGCVCVCVCVCFVFCACACVRVWVCVFGPSLCLVATHAHENCGCDWVWWLGRG